MARRSSARLRNRNSSTPKRVSLSHDTQIKTPRTAPVKLSSLQESDEMPGAFPRSVSPPELSTPSAENKRTTTVLVNFDSVTPTQITPMKPSDEEMHPQHHQQSTSKPLEEARWLGFSKMGPHTEPLKQVSRIGVLESTPTKAPKLDKGEADSRFSFTFRREHSLELSQEAKKLMLEKRDEAARIREQMVAAGEGPADKLAAARRKLATPQGKRGRFSEVHMGQFKQMDSIAGHASAFRSAKAATTSGQAQQHASTPAKSLKRSPSKAQLDEAVETPVRTAPRSILKATAVAHSTSSLPRAASSKNPRVLAEVNSESPTKRTKHSAKDDAATAKLSAINGGKVQRSAPQQSKAPYLTYPDLSSFNSPTQASLARTSSTNAVDSSKIPAPAFVPSPSKPADQATMKHDNSPSTPLLLRSPSKITASSKVDVEMTEAAKGSPLLLRSPSKPSPSKRGAEIESQQEPKAKEAPLLCKSPFKMSVARNTEQKSADSEAPSSNTALLSRSPVKISIAKNTAAETTDDDSSHSDALLARSPIKAAILENTTTNKESQSTASSKHSGGGLMGRFNLLHTSPVKSILRSPQRLYSDDPAKVAAGTHLATPPKFQASKHPSNLPKPTSTSDKRVDFTSSTKARYERAQSEASSTPPETSTSSPKPENNEIATTPTTTTTFGYPTLTSVSTLETLTPQTRRQTIVPGDFTFTANNHGIIFSKSPNASTTSPPTTFNRKSTIRHVSAEPALPAIPQPPTVEGRKKRKFDFENENVAAEIPAADKENVAEAQEEEQRPAKRAKPSRPERAAVVAQTVKPETRVPTLGVKPKKSVTGGQDGKGGERKPSTISRSRLNALAQPKRRV